MKIKEKNEVQKFQRQISLYLYPFFVPIGRQEPEKSEELVLYRFEFLSPCAEGWLRAEELTAKSVPSVYSYIMEKRLNSLTNKVIAYIRGKVYIFGILGSVTAVQEGKLLRPRS